MAAVLHAGFPEALYHCKVQPAPLRAAHNLAAADANGKDIPVSTAATSLQSVTTTSDRHFLSTGFLGVNTYHLLG